MINVTVTTRGEENLLKLSNVIGKFKDEVVNDVVEDFRGWLKQGCDLYRSRLGIYVNSKSAIFYTGIDDRTGGLWSLVLNPTEPVVRGNIISGSIIDPESAKFESVRGGGGGTGGGIQYTGLLEMIEYGHGPWTGKDGKPLRFLSWKTGKWHTIFEHPGFSKSNALHDTMNQLREIINKELSTVVYGSLYRTIMSLHAEIAPWMGKARFYEAMRHLLK